MLRRSIFGSFPDHQTQRMGYTIEGVCRCMIGRIMESSLSDRQLLHSELDLRDVSELEHSLYGGDTDYP